MKISAPDSWLDEVDVPKLRQWFIDQGFHTSLGRYLDRGNESVLLPFDLKGFRDWKTRLLEAIEFAAELEKITAAEWFERNRVVKGCHEFKTTKYCLPESWSERVDFLNEVG